VRTAKMAWSGDRWCRPGYRMLSAERGISLTGLGPEGGIRRHGSANRRFAQRTVTDRDRHAPDPAGRVTREAETINQLVSEIEICTTDLQWRLGC
jgi:hypothetical protein